MNLISLHKHSNTITKCNEKMEIMTIDAISYLYLQELLEFSTCIYNHIHKINFSL